MPKKSTLTPAIWDSSTWAKEGLLFLIFRNKQLCSFASACISKAAHPSTGLSVSCGWFARHYGCYSCSFIHVVIDFVFDKGRELNGASPNTAVLMLINVGNGDQRKKSQRPLGETKTEKREKQMWVRPLFCFQLITLSVHWQEKWSAEEKKQHLFSGSSCSHDNCLLSVIVCSQWIAVHTCFRRLVTTWCATVCGTQKTKASS